VLSYHRNIHSLLDVRFTGQARLDDESNLGLIDITSRIATRVRGQISGKGPYEPTEFGNDIQRILETTRNLHPQTVQSLQGLVDWSVSLDTSDLADFRNLWGRGQQYISLTRLS
jgi:hypothetical protein